MAEENQNISRGSQPAASPTTTANHEEPETKQPAGGIFDYLRKKKEEYLPTAAPVTQDATAAAPVTKNEGEENKEMAPEEKQNNISHGYQQPAAPITATHDDESEIKDRSGLPANTTHDDESENKDRGMLDFLGKKKDQEEEEKEKVVPAETHVFQPAAPVSHEESENKDRGMLDFLGKKKDQEEEEKEKVVPAETHHGYQPAAPVSHEESENKDRGMLDFLGKKKEEEKEKVVPAETHGYQPAAPATTTHDESEIKDRGMLDFLGKKKEEEEKVVPAETTHGNYQSTAPATTQDEMEEEHIPINHGDHLPAAATTHDEESKIKDRGMFDDFLGKKKEEEEKVVPTETHGYQPAAAPATAHDEMAEEHIPISHGNYQPTDASTTHDEEESKIKDRGMFNFLGKKKEEEVDQKVVPAETHGYHQPAASAINDKEESEIKDRGMFDFLKKKKQEEEKVVPTAAHQNDVMGTEHEQGGHASNQYEEPEKKVAVHEVDKEDEKKHHSSLLEKLQRSDSNSSSSSDEEVEENGEKIRRKKKKGLKEKIHEKISGDHNKAEEPAEKKNNYYQEDSTTVPIEKQCDDTHTHEGETPYPEEKKGFLEKIKGKLHKKPADEDHHGVTHPVNVAPAAPSGHPVAIDHHKYASPTDAAHHDGEEAKEKKGFLGKIKEKLPGRHKSDDHLENKDTPTHY